VGKENHQLLKLKVDVSRETGGLLFLVDTGADVSLIKGSRLIGTTEFNPDAKVNVKCVDGSSMETHGTIDANFEVGSELIAHRFQLVNKQVDIPYDGILGRDFLQRTKARICYETGTVILLGERYTMVGKVKPSEKKVMTVRQIKLPLGQKVSLESPWPRERLR